MEGILKLNLSEIYTCEIKGLGEVFEIVSIETLRKSLLTKYKHGVLFLASNSDHSGRGFTKEDLEAAIIKDKLQLTSSGYADAPPWKSNPKEEADKGLAYNKLIIRLAEILFKLWIPAFERFYRTRNKAHVTWALGI
ncbi:MAG: hypothetical protein APR54_10375 [Candidatus Cloacimonas sp. SDB]|nr:MAG: hypothetical protein APR54_10375 [Candidatus Cloacimonas sp. SDB]